MTYTVIVAEDEELLLTNLVQKIQKADPDFQVAGTAQTGDQALALIEKLSPDLVVTDIRMPVMDGITLLTKVREQFPFTKFIITSGFSDFEYAKKAITLKVSDYLLKPVDSEELKEALSKIKQEFNLNLIADNMNYSPSYLTKIFCQVYGCTPSKYLITLRMSHAQRLLVHEPGLSVKQIGEMCGYHDQGYFSRIFKKHTGKSPLEFRG